MPAHETDDGRLVSDTAGLRAVTGRPAYAIRTICTRGPDGYPLYEAVAALEQHPDPVLLTAAEAEQYLGIPANRIYQWVHRKQIAPTERDQHGRPRYLLDDLTRLRNRDARRAQLDL